MKYANPYTPGAGFMPGYLAGRTAILEEADKYLKTLVLGYPQQSVIYYGLRGVGKTVVLNSIEKEIEDSSILMEHIEIAEKRNFTQQIVNASKKFIHKMSVKETVRDIATKVQGILKAFSVTYNPNEQTFTLSANDDEYITTGDLSVDMTDLFVSMGKLAEKTGYSICFLVDEIQYMKEEEAEALVNAIHRCNQLRLPIMIFGAGLPKILKMLGEIKSYSERLFKFVEIDALNVEESREAIIKPAEPMEVSYTDNAINEIVTITQGYPHFIQEMCSSVWDVAESNTIDKCDIKKATPIFYHNLDSGFYKVRYERCTPMERMFIIAMVKCGELPCTISNVAKIMERSVKSISTYRAQLINKGVIYATAHAEVDFTVPGFDDYIKRMNPELKMDFDVE